MKKVNFNALQNFEVPESWIENAINAKPKKKPFYLNPRYYGTAAALVIAVGIAAFSLLYLNRDFTPPTGQNVEGTSVSSTLSGQRLTEILSGGEMKTTELQNEKKPTEKQKSTGATEQNENSVEQSVASDEQHNESSESENHSPVQAEESEQDEQSNNTKKPESIIKPQNPTAPIEEQKSSEQESNMSEEPESTVPGESYTITTGWDRSFYYTTDSQSLPENFKKYETETRVCYNGLFEKTINVSIPNDIWNQDDDIVFLCTISGVDKSTNGISGTLEFEFEFLQPEKLIIDLSKYSINIPCGYYDIDFECRIYGSDQSFCSQSFSNQLLNNDENIELQLAYNN